MIFQVDNAYNPEKNLPISNETKLAKGIMMAKFLGGYGNAANLNHITDDNDKLIIAKQYCMHASAMKTVSENFGKFRDYRLVVAEGLYKPYKDEQLQINSVNYLKSKGRTVVYELRDQDGNIAHERTYDLAVYWKDNLQFEKLVLSYDTIAPDGSLMAQLILTMPRIIPPWTVEYKNEIATDYNFENQTVGEFTEILKSG